jgi:hypothetical protein
MLQALKKQEYIRHFVRYLEGRYNSWDLGVVWKMLLKWILEKYALKMQWTEFYWLRLWSVEEVTAEWRTTTLWIAWGSKSVQIFEEGSELIFFNLHSGGWSPNWVHSARRPFIGLLYLPRVIVRIENLVEWMAGETEVLGENLAWRHFVHHKSHLTRPGIEPGPPRWEASD